MSIKLAFVGYGGIAGWHHENIAKRVPEVEVCGAFDINPERQKAAAENGLRAYSSMEELLNDQSVGLITIATPNNFHKPIAIAAMQSGKHVVCEKPVALNAKELEEMIEASKKYNRVFTVHQNRRWDEDYLMVKKTIEDGTIGKPYYIETRASGSRGCPEGWRSRKAAGGGMVFDFGAHIIDQILTMLNTKVVEIWAQTVKVTSTEVDDNFKALLRMSDGVTVQVEVNTNCFIQHPRWHVSGTDGTMVINDWSMNGQIIRPAKGVPLIPATALFTEGGPIRMLLPREAANIEALPLPEIKSNWSEYYKNVIDAINGEAEVIVKPDQTLRLMNVIDTIFVSAEAGKAISCDI